MGSGRILNHEAQFFCGGTSHLMADRFIGAPWKSYLVNWKQTIIRMYDLAKAAKQAPVLVNEGEKAKDELHEACKVVLKHVCAEAKRKLGQRAEDKKRLRVSKASPCMANIPATSSISTPSSSSGSGNGIEDIEDEFADDAYTPRRALAGWSLAGQED